MNLTALPLLLCASLPLLADSNAERLRHEQQEFLDNVTSIFEVESCAIKGLVRTLSCRVLYADRDIVSYRLENYDYSGGAHGNSTVAVGTYGRGCLARGRLTLKDIAPTRADYSRLTALLRWEAQRQFKVRTYQELAPTSSETSGPSRTSTSTPRDCTSSTTSTTSPPSPTASSNSASAGHAPTA